MKLAPPVPSLARAANGRAMERVIGGALSLLSTQPLTWSATLLVTVMIPRYLGATALGEFTFVMGVAGLIGVAVSLGLPNWLTRSVAASENGAAHDVAGAVVLQLAVATLGAACVVLAGPFLHLPISPLVLELAMVGLVASSVLHVLYAALIGRERHTLYAWTSAVMTALTAVAGVAVLAAGGRLTALVASGAVIASVTLLITWRVSGVRLSGAALDPRLAWRLARNGLPFLGWNLALQVYGQVDKIMLPFLAAAAVVGWYGAAYRIIAIPVFIPTLIVTPLLPVLSRFAEHRETFSATLGRSLLLSLLLTVPLAAMIMVMAPAIPSLLGWGSEFQHSVPLMIILAVHEPIVAVDMVLACGLLALKRERAWLCVGVVASIFNPAANLLLIPLFERLLQNGAIGASLVTVATELLMLAGALIVLPTGVLRGETVSLAARTVLAGAGCAVPAVWLRPIILPLAPVAGGLVFIGLCLLFRVLRPAELLTLARMPRDLLSRRLARVHD